MFSIIMFVCVCVCSDGGQCIAIHLQASAQVGSGGVQAWPETDATLPGMFHLWRKRCGRPGEGAANFCVQPLPSP